jgi:hypothetical protein
MTTHAHHAGEFAALKLAAVVATKRASKASSGVKSGDKFEGNQHARAEANHIRAMLAHRKIQEHPAATTADREEASRMAGYHDEKAINHSSRALRTGYRT